MSQSHTHGFGSSNKRSEVKRPRVSVIIYFYISNNMKRLKTQILFTLATSIMLSSCVAKKEFDALFNEKTNLENENASLKENLEIAEEKISRLEVQVEEYKARGVVKITLSRSHLVAIIITKNYSRKLMTVRT